ncbi:unnamed protein product [Diamesa tonsa]
MNLWQSKFVQIICGFLIGILLAGFILNSESVDKIKNVVKYSSNLMAKKGPQLDNRALADEMFDNVRVLCWVMTNPKNHKTKAIHVKNTWGKRCNKLLFISSEADLELGTIALPVNEGRDNLWDKTKSAFQYVYQNHYDDADWFLKADDDSYLIMENVRYLLSQYHPETSLYFGCRFITEMNREGYMAGGGYILSKKALRRCLENTAIFVDTRDDLNQMRFFPISVEEHMEPERLPDYWYFDYLYYNVTQGSMDCCSDTVAGLHYIDPIEMYMLDYLIYDVRPYGFVLNTESVNRMRNVMKYNSNLMAKNAPQVDDRTLADEMFKKVRVLCWVMTNPKNHKTKAIHVKNTWGKRCNKLLFMSSETDLELGSVALPVNEGRDNLWDKTKSAFQYVYQNHYDEADWFLKADDDSYVILENMRYMLAQYRASTSLFFGCRFANNNNPEGYMSGGGYILSKKALSKFNQKILNNGDICKGSETGDEDFEMGKCLENTTIFVDTRDEQNQMRFFPLSVEDHFQANRDPDYWYFQNLYYNVTQGSLDCCSDSVAGLHYIDPKEILKMKKFNSTQFWQFVCGILIGILLANYFVLYVKDYVKTTSEFKITLNSLQVLTNDDLYDRTLADEIFKKVRVLCWVMTNPKNHKTKAIHVKNTWGKRCNKLLFMSSETDLELGAVALPVDEGRNTLWDKTKSAFQYVYQNHYDDADWFLKADDDSYLIMENVRYLLSQYHHETSLYFGCRYMTLSNLDGYMAGGGYILSKKALSKFNNKILPNKNICRPDDHGAEDLEMGKCLEKTAIFVDTRDDKNQMTFFQMSVEEHFNPNRIPDNWYWKYLYYNVTQGSMDCCSKTLAGLHYITPREMYMLDYLIYDVKPYGIEQHDDKKPPKLPLAEILRRSNEKSSSPNFREHEVIHEMEESEKYFYTNKR